MISWAGHHLPCQVRKLLYQSFFLPNLDYCSAVWNSCGVVLSSKVGRIQNYAHRPTFHKPPHTSSADLLEILGWTTLRTRRHIAMSNPLVLEEESSKLSHMQISYKLKSETRGANKIHLNRPNTSFFSSNTCTSIQQPPKRNKGHNFCTYLQTCTERPDPSNVYVIICFYFIPG